MTFYDPIFLKYIVFFVFPPFYNIVESLLIPSYIFSNLKENIKEVIEQYHKKGEGGQKGRFLPPNIELIFRPNSLYKSL